MASVGALLATAVVMTCLALAAGTSPVLELIIDQHHLFVADSPSEFICYCIDVVAIEYWNPHLNRFE